MCCGCDTSYIVSVHIQCQASIYTLPLCCGHSWRVRLAKQETLTPPGHLVSALVYRGPWVSTVVLYYWCHSDSASVLLYFRSHPIRQTLLILLCFILRAMRLPNKPLRQGYDKERLIASVMTFYGRYGDLIKSYKKYEVHSPGYYTTFWKMTICSDILRWSHITPNLGPCYLPNSTLLPNLIFYPIV